MKNKVKNLGFCEFCKTLKVNKLTYTVYRIGFFTTMNFYTIGIVNVIPDLDKYLFSKGFHISASQVILLRPDILLEYLKKEFDEKNEKVKSCFLFEAIICEECFEKYKKEVPEI